MGRVSVNRAAQRWCLGVLCLLLLAGMAARDVLAADGEVKLVFTYGSEKKAWLTAVTKDFMAAGHKTEDGKKIVVEAIPMGSGTMTQELLDGAREPHLVSPASSVFIRLANAKMVEDKPIVGPTRSLVRSPVVIAMWKKMAVAMGWGIREVGWAEVLGMVNNPEGWLAYDFPKWGRFKFGHTHPEYSNSGIISLLAQAYAAAGKTEDLTIEDVRKQETADFLHEIAGSVVHYGSSTGFFGRKMFKNGPEYISAAVLYENMVIESYKMNLEEPVVAIYPKEGTFWSDHPVGVVNGKWVTDEHRAAAQIYINYLLGKPQQEKAMAFGFRPGDPKIKLGAPFDAAHGVDPEQPKKVLEVPRRNVIEAVVDVWRTQKKPANIVLAIDVSGSMNQQERMKQAREGAVQVVKMLGDQDQVSILAFANEGRWIKQDLKMSKDRETAIKTIKDLKAWGKTALYDAVELSYKHLVKTVKPDVISAMIVLSDGADTSSNVSHKQLLKQIKFDPNKQAIMIFTIGYGAEASETILSDLAQRTQAKFFKGDPQNIREVLEENAAFFSAASARTAAKAAKK